MEFIRFIEQSLVDASRLIFATSEEERDLFVSDFGTDSKRVALVPNGFEPFTADDAAASPHGRNEDGKPYTQRSLEAIIASIATLFDRVRWSSAS